MTKANINVKSSYNRVTFSSVAPGSFYLSEDGKLYQKSGTGKVDLNRTFGKRTVGAAFRVEDGRVVWHRNDKKVQKVTVNIDVTAV